MMIQVDNIEVKVFLKNETEIKDIIGVNFEKKTVFAKNFFKNGRRQKINSYYNFDDVYFEIFINNKKFKIDKFTYVE